MSTHVIPYTEPRSKATGRPVFSQRHRTMQTEDGHEVRATITRYSWGWGYRPTSGPRGGRWYQRFPRQVYYADGRFWKTRTRALDQAGTEFDTVLVPVTGTVTDAHPAHSKARGIPVVTITCDHGYPLHVDTEGGSQEFWNCVEGASQALIDALSIK